MAWRTAEPQSASRNGSCGCRQGLLGDAKPVGEGVAELRVDHGSGYGVYFAQRGRLLIILLCGGDKKSQKRDIKRAKALAMELEDSSWSRQNRSTRRVI